MWRQVTGFTVIDTKNSAEKEFDRLGFLPREIFTSTGIQELDKAIKMKLAPVIALGVSNFVESDIYKGLDNNQKALILKSMLTEIKADVMESVRKDSDIVPYLLEYDLRNIPNDKKKVILDYLGKDFFNEIIDQFQNKKTKDKKIILPENLN